MRKHLESFAKYGGFVAMGLEWSALLFFYLRAPGYFSGEYPISFFATLPETKLAFSLFYVAAATSFWVFATKHLKKHFKTPLIIFAVSMIAFVVVALLPYDPNVSLVSAIHNTMAIITFGAFWIGMLVMARQSDDKRFSLVTRFAVALSIFLMMGFAFSAPGSPFILLFEASSWFICQLWIVWVSYLTYKKSMLAVA